MCQSVFVIGENKRLGTARQLADWLGIKPEELITADYEPMPVDPEYAGWRDSCLCPFCITANLDAHGVFHRRDDHDSMMYLALPKVDKVELENERLRKTLERYGHHDEGCVEEPWHGKGPRFCSCGFFEARRADT